MRCLAKTALREIGVRSDSQTRRRENKERVRERVEFNAYEKGLKLRKRQTGR
jgi:hypothetical protein